MKDRIWYPQLDVYDTARRIGLLLSAWPDDAPLLERLYIADFYLANPPLLHRTSMPAHVRGEFQKLSIPRPEKTFLSYPTAPILFHKMDPIQRKAFQALVGKGVVTAEGVRQGVARLSDFGRQFIEEDLSEHASIVEAKLIAFLTTSFAVLGEGNTKELRQRTGLRRLV